MLFLKTFENLPIPAFNPASGSRHIASVSTFPDPASCRLVLFAFDNPVKNLFLLRNICLAAMPSFIIALTCLLCDPVHSNLRDRPNDHRVFLPKPQEPFLPESVPLCPMERSAEEEIRGKRRSAVLHCNDTWFRWRAKTELYACRKAFRGTLLIVSLLPNLCFKRPRSLLTVVVPPTARSSSATTVT